MGLKIIGAGFGRTGTTSMKEALELLGYNKCHHMREVMVSSKQVKLFDSVSRNVEVDWDDVFAGFEAAVDWPAAARYDASTVAKLVMRMGRSLMGFSCKEYLLPCL